MAVVCSILFAVQCGVGARVQEGRGFDQSTLSSFYFERNGIAIPQHAEVNAPLTSCLSVVLRAPAEEAPHRCANAGIEQSCSSLPPLFIGQAPPKPGAPSDVSAMRADEAASTASPAAPSASGVDSTFDVYFGNVPHDADPTLLGELIQFVGQGELHVPRDAEGHHKGFMFGKFSDEASANYAMQVLQGVHILEKPLTVKWSKRSR